MFTLDKSKNDTSVALDLLRAVAAQMVCVGHAWNFGIRAPTPSTTIPSIGLLFFFILSGFVIAHTLKSKTENADYSLWQYGVERFCRIYCAYLPAMLLIGACYLVARYFELDYGRTDPADGLTYLANLSMLQMLPTSMHIGTFWTAGQMSSISREFHIYFFVGALYFLCIGRQRVLAAIVAVLSTRMPLGNFIAEEGGALFLLWLIGFSIYFVVISIKIDLSFAAVFAATAVGILYLWSPFGDRKDVYDIANFPALGLCFAVLVIGTQCTHAAAASAVMTKLTHFFASYSLTLFLLHLTIIRTIFALWPNPSWTEFAVAIVIANLLSAALAFSPIGEIQYKRLSRWLIGKIRPTARASGASPLQQST